MMIDLTNEIIDLVENESNEPNNELELDLELDMELDNIQFTQYDIDTMFQAVLESDMDFERVSEQVSERVSELEQLSDHDSELEFYNALQAKYTQRIHTHIKHPQRHPSSTSTPELLEHEQGVYKQGTINTYIYV